VNNKGSYSVYGSSANKKGDVLAHCRGDVVALKNMKRKSCDSLLNKRVDDMCPH
jgi:hypothetical protein